MKSIQSTPGEKNQKKLKLNLSLFNTKAFPYYLIIPSAIVLLLIQIYPTFYTINLSLNKIRAGQLMYVGFENFNRLLHSSDFYRSLKLTGIYAGWYLIATIVGGMIIALLLNKRTPLTSFYMVLLFIPWVLSDVVSGTMWRWMFQQSYGLVQVILNPLINNVSLLSNETGAMVIVIAASVWRALAFTALLFLGALQTIPNEIKEAAELDGANLWSSFWLVTIPMISPTILITIMMTSIRGINSLGLILAITSGGPGSATATSAMLLYRMAWKFGDFGDAAALAVMLFLVNLLLTFIYFRLIRVEQ